MFDPEYTPLSAGERHQLNRVSTPEHTRARLYGRDLLATADCYTRAADAVGLRKDAARYLANEGARLHREGMLWLDRADELEGARA